MEIDKKNKMTKQIVLIGDNKYYIHPVFTNYAASKEGEVINVKTGRIMRGITGLILDIKKDTIKQLLQKKTVKNTHLNI